MKLFYILPVFLLYFVFMSDAAGNFDQAYLLPPLPSYVILAPRQIRPGTTYQASVTILKMMYSSLAIRLTMKNNDTEFSHGTVFFKNPGTQLLRLEIPERATESKNYYMEVIGSLTENGAIIFSNRSKIDFKSRDYSAFIQMSKPIYHQSQVVRFRIIPVKSNLMPKLGMTTYIEMIDANNYIVKRWFNPTTNVGGVYELEFPLADQVTEGTWYIRYVTDKWSQKESFDVREYWQPRFDVNVSIPVRFSELGFGVFGILTANETSGMPVEGHASLNLQIRDPKSNKATTKPLVNITRKYNYFKGKVDFLFSTDELKKELTSGSLSDKDVWVYATVHNRFEMMTRKGWAYSYIYSDTPRLKLFGGSVRPYKPGMPFSIYMSVSQPDGSPPINTLNRRIELEIKCSGGSDQIFIDSNIVVPDTGIIKKTITLAQLECSSAEIRASYKTDRNEELVTATQHIFAYQSFSKAYLQITMANEHVRVNEYAVFYVEMNYPTNKLHYQIISQGNIVYVDSILLERPVKTRTISLAISREMAPVSRLVAFYVKSDGEIISDSLSFFVNITNINNVHVKVNRGKDLNVDTLEINGYGEPGAYLALNVLHYDLYKRGAKNILRDYSVISQLQHYEIANTQMPYQQDWYHDLEYVERAYMAAPSSGADTNSTMYNSGLLLFTDAEFMKVNFNHDCNETRDASQAFPCYVVTGKQCYTRAQRCDGVPDCTTMADEAGCPEKSTTTQVTRKDMLEQFNMLNRHWNDGEWLWKSYWIKPNGRINFRVNLPKIDTSWVVGAFAVDRIQGFSIIERPALFSGLRRFYMVVEAPEEVMFGEQIGVRVTLFNYWNYWTEGLLVIERSKDYQIVQVGEYGRVSSYDPTTTRNQQVHTLVYLSAGEARYIFLPIIPDGPGNSTLKLCAHTFIGSNCVEKEFRVTMNGVENFYHHAALIDLTSKSARLNWNFKIPLRQSFYEPEERRLRYVPGSKLSRASVAGDIFGPTLSKKMPSFNMYEKMRLTHGAMENVFFEYGMNIQFLKYLRSWPTDDTDIISDHVIDYCSVVLQDALTYHNPKDGGFSNFRDTRNESDTLSTAFAVWNLQSAMVDLGDINRKMYVPEKLIETAIMYLLKVQDKTPGDLEGSFKATNILNYMFLPTNISDTLSDTQKEAQRRIPITAMVVLALAERSGQGMTQITNAVTFLKKHIQKTTDQFSQIIGTYALTKGNIAIDSEVDKMLIKIVANAFKIGDTIYFSNHKVLLPMKEEINSGTMVLNPRLELPNDAYTVASSALAMMLMKERSKWEYGDVNTIEMIQFLAAMRNHNNGFASTFDSLMAMRSLQAFSNSDRNRAWYKLYVEQAISSNINWERQFYINKLNYSFGSETTIPNEMVWGDVMFKAEGTGRVLLQLDTTSRSYSDQRIRNPKDPNDVNNALHSFNIYCEPIFTGRNSSVMTMNVCGHWTGNKGTLARPSTGLTVFELSIPTGFVILNDHLREVVQAQRPSSLRYAKFWPGRISLYLNQLTPTNTCVTFTAHRYYPVANVSRDQLCSAYDYYEPGRYNRSVYRVEALYSNNICNVFGSYQCPYSPFYNSALPTALFRTRLSSFITLLFFCILVLLQHISIDPFAPNSFISSPFSLTNT